jgi:hypothetical protein
VACLHVTMSFPKGICDVGLQKAPPYRQKTAVERGTQIRLCVGRATRLLLTGLYLFVLPCQQVAQRARHRLNGRPAAADDFELL